MCVNNCSSCFQSCSDCLCTTPCSTCNSCSCVECSNASNACGCEINTTTNCIFLKGISSSCITGLVTGISLTDAINLQNTKICSLANPSGHVYTVTSCDTNIAVTTTNPDSTHTNYQVCLDDAFVDQVEDNTAAIATLTTCTTGLVGDITTGTPLYLTITNTGADTPCGRVYNINYNPSGNTILDGIIYNDTTARPVNGTAGVGTGGDQQLTTHTENLLTRNLFSNRDNVIVVVEGQYAYDEIISHLSDTVTINIKNGGATVFSISNIASRSVNKSGYHCEITLTKTGVATGLLTGFWFNNLVSNGTESAGGNSLPKTVFAKSIAGLDYNAFTVEVRDLNDSLLGTSYNFLSHLQIEVRKYI